MKQQWKFLVPLMLSGGLMACTTTSGPAQQEKPVNVDQTKSQPAETKEAAPAKTTKTVITPKEEGKKLSDGKLILGSKEWIYVPSLKDNFNTRIDTGAATSSISAIDVTPFERDGKDWVKFKIEHDGIKSEEVSLPVERWVRIRQASDEKGQRRPVVMMWVEVGDLKEQTEFTLADRTHLTYPLLLGRSFFKDIAVVDVSRTYIQGKHE
ncbi:ATP-dependent zinc protease family protein [Vibrio porteresiae]|uniref:ATP-dependent zinc protease n=1 Tax=Vibrio porteresiae DSM 19223 TaxID=1123496 RepID=A0ABZ0QHQ6_9VIBR|nr:ATP-dependent zinc protease [Vibrio porteresiae]WPC76029.1 ATP-dependent zinc protease [Vibrio porteresiae DSM 19223]